MKGLVVGAKAGDYIDVYHGGETIRVHIAKVGEHRIRLVFDGPKTFEVVRGAVFGGECRNAQQSQ